MIKRYNQFLNENIEGELPHSLEYQMSNEFPQNPNQEFEEEEEVAVDPYTDALQSLADAAEKAGLNYNIVITDKETISAVKINDKEVTFPSETQKYHVEGVKKPFDTLEEVLAYFDSGVSPEARQEVRDEMTSISDEEVLDRQEQFESKSYKSTRIRK